MWDLGRDWDSGTNIHILVVCGIESEPQASLHQGQITKNMLIIWHQRAFSHTWNPCIRIYSESYFFGGTWPTLTRTQMTFRVCIPTEQETSSPRVRPTDVLVVGMEESSMHCPHKPVCQWYTVQGWSLQFLTSCRALMLGHWIPPEKWFNINQRQCLSCTTDKNKNHITSDTGSFRV